MPPVKLLSYGSSVGVLLPPEVLVPLKAGPEDVYEVIHTQDGPLLVAVSLEVSDQLYIGRQVMRDHAGVLRELAKS